MTTRRDLGAERGLPRLQVIEPPAQWADGEPPPRPWICAGWIPARQVTMLGGDGGLGKSLLAQQLLSAAALGKTWLGEPVRACRALGVFCEDDPDELWRRQADICRACGVEIADLDNLALLSRVGLDNALMAWPEGPYEPGEPTALFGQVMNLALDFGAEIVVIDSLHDVFAGDENRRNHARAFIGLLRTLATEIDGSVVLCAHPSLSGRNSGTGEAGSTAWNNAVRSRLYLSRPADEPDPNIRNLRSMKANYAAAGKDLRLRWLDGHFMREDPAGGIVGNIQRRIAETKLLHGLEALLDEGFAPSPAIEARSNYVLKMLAGRPEVADLTTRALQEALSDLMARGEIVVAMTDDPPSRRKKIIRPKNYRR